MSWFRLGRGKRSRSAATAATSPRLALQQRVDACIASTVADPALDTAALTEASAVLDEQLDSLTNTTATVDLAAINTVVQLHRLRALGLGNPNEELHACMALQVLVHAVDPSAVPPQVYPEVADAISRGAPTDRPMALLRAMQGHASAVRAAWRRHPIPDLADTYVRAFERLVELAGPDVPGFPTRLLDLAVARDARSQALEPHGDPGDLREAVRLVDQALTVAADDAAITIRAHQLRGPMLVGLDEIEPGVDALVRAAESFRTLVQLTDPADPRHKEYQFRLAGVQRLLDGAGTPPTDPGP